MWHRSKLRPDGSGSLVCPDEGRGLDGTTLGRMAAERARSRERHEPPFRVQGAYRTLPEETMPRVASPLTLHLNGIAGVTTDSDGRLTELACQATGRVFTPKGNRRAPLHRGSSINGRQAIGTVSSTGEQWVSHEVGEPIAASTHTVFYLLDQPRVDTKQTLLLISTGLYSLAQSFALRTTVDGTYEAFGFPGSGGSASDDAGEASVGKKLLIMDVYGDVDFYEGLEQSAHLDTAIVRSPGTYIIGIGGRYASVGVGPSGETMLGTLGEVAIFSPSIAAASEREAMVRWFNRRWGLV